METAFLCHQADDGRHSHRHHLHSKYEWVVLVKVTGRKEYASLPVICGTFAKGSRQGSPIVAEALYQLEREDRHFHVIDASDLSLQSDKLHFDARGAEKLGKRVFDKIKALYTL